MRTLRPLLGAAVALATVLVVAPTPAGAAAPAAPYTAMSVEGRDTYVLDPSDATVILSENSPNRLTYSAFQSVAPEHMFSGIISPPTGQALAAGMTFPTLHTPDATHGELNMGVDGYGCDEENGLVTIRELTRDPGTQAVTAFAASYRSDCGPWQGEIRWHSGVPYGSASVNADHVDFGPIDLGIALGPETVTVTSNGPGPFTFGASTITGTAPGAYSVSGDTCANTVVPAGHTCTVSITAHPTAVGPQPATLVIPDDQGVVRHTVALAVSGFLGAAGAYFALPPQRLLDTRDGTGATHAGPLGSDSALHLQVTGRGGVPSDGVSAVVLNVTATGPTGSSYLTAYPTGVARPTASNLNFPPGWTGANAVTVPVGDGGQVDIYNHLGTVQVIADVVGYYAATDMGGSVGPGGFYQKAIPTRLLDTRDKSFGGPLPSGFFVTVPVDFGPTVNQTIRALAVNVTAVNPTSAGFLTTWNGVDDLPSTSTLNFTPHTVVPNLAIIPTAPCPYPDCAGLPSVAVYNGSPGNVDVVVDIFGFYDNGSLPGGLRFHPLTPTRITDTRSGLGAPHALGAGQTATVTTPGTVAHANTYALATNVTAVSPTATTYLTVWPAGVPGLGQPTVSNLNPGRGQIVPNAVFAGVGPAKQFNIFNFTGTVDVVVDVAGTFDALTIPTAPALRAYPAALPVGARPSYLHRY